MLYAKTSVREVELRIRNVGESGESVDSAYYVPASGMVSRQKLGEQARDEAMGATLETV